MVASYSQIIAHCNERVSPPVLPPDLPAVDARVLRLTQTVCDMRIPALAASVGIDLVRVEVIDATCPLPDSRPSMRDPAVLSISFAPPDMATQQAQAHVELDLDQYPQLRIALGPPGNAAAKRQSALTQGVAQLLVEPLFVKLRALGLSHLRVAGLARGTIEATGEPLVGLTLSPLSEGQADPRLNGDGDGNRDHRVAMPEASLACIDAMLAQMPIELKLGTTPIAGSIVIGAKRLAVDTLARLQAGDVLLRAVFPSLDARLLAPAARSQDLDEGDAGRAPPIEAAYNVVAAWGTPGLVRLCAPARFDGASAIIIKEPSMSDHLEPAFADVGISLDQQAAPVRISDLELPVQFEIDTLAIPLSQLCAIGPGYVIEFPVPFRDARVRLVVHGNTIGHGELVTVGEHMGVRIVRMAHHDNALTETNDGSI